MNIDKSSLYGRFKCSSGVLVRSDGLQKAATTQIGPEFWAVAYFSFVAVAHVILMFGQHWSVRFKAFVNYVEADEVKPGNVLISLDLLDVKLADFGLAHAVTASLSSVSMARGTPLYAAAASCCGTGVDRLPADLWRLSCTTEL